MARNPESRGEFMEGLAGRGEGLSPRIVLTGIFFIVCIVLCLILGCTLFGPSDYNSYTLQAMAWREGRIALGQDYEWLELAVYEGDWYVSFPPVPTIPVYLLTFFFGIDTPDALLVKLYALVGMLAIYSALSRRGNIKHAAFMALMMTLGGSMLPLILDGAVWYQAQTLAFCLTTCFIALMFSGRLTLALLLYALSVGCRPFNVCYGPLMMLLWFWSKRSRPFGNNVRRLAPGIVLGLTVAAAYAAYNYIRFDDIFEFGHNYLPEFTRSAYGQFSIHHFVENAGRFLFGLPAYWTAEGWKFETFGCSVFLGNPMLILLLVWYISDVAHRRAGAYQHMTMAVFFVHLALLLLHRTGGGFQLGARYAVDLVPYCLIYMKLKRRPYAVRRWEAALLISGFIFMFIGSTQVYLG